MDLKAYGVVIEECCMMCSSNIEGGPPLLAVNTSGLRVGSSNLVVNATVSREKEASTTLLFAPILPSMLAVPSDTPQVLFQAVSVPKGPYIQAQIFN